MRTDKERSARHNERYKRFIREDVVKFGNYIPPANLHLGIAIWIAFFVLIAFLIAR